MIRADIREAGFLRFLDIPERGAGGRNAGLHAAASEPFQRGDLKVIEKRAQRGFAVKGPVVIGVDRLRILAEQAGEPGIELIGPCGRTISRGVNRASMVSSSARLSTPVDLGNEKITRRDVEERKPEPVLCRIEGGEIVVVLGVEQVGVEHRSRRHDPDHFALHDPLGELRVLHLFADGDLEAAPDEFGNVSIRRVIREIRRAASRCLWTCSAP